jgi:hypothetical protein
MNEIIRVIFIIYLLVWNFGIVGLEIYSILKKIYIPKIFASFCSIGLGLAMCLPLPLLQIHYSSFKPSIIWFSLIILFSIIISSYPIAYFVYKYIYKVFQKQK